MKIGLIGSGSFGTALGSLLADKGYDVMMWTRSPDQAASINNDHKNNKHLSSLILPEKMTATTNLEEVIQNKELLLFAPPSHVISDILGKIKDIIPENIPIVSASKGIENDSLRLVSDIFEEILPENYHQNLSFLSGPSFAKEIIQKSECLSVFLRIFSAFQGMRFSACCLGASPSIQYSNLRNTISMKTVCGQAHPQNNRPKATVNTMINTTNKIMVIPNK
jgi:glycerol-3-phosphate dehydrogenase